MAEALAPQDHLYTLVERGGRRPAPDRRQHHRLPPGPRPAGMPPSSRPIPTSPSCRSRSPRRATATAAAPASPDADHDLRRHRDGSRTTAPARAIHRSRSSVATTSPATVTPPGGPPSSPPAVCSAHSPTGPTGTARSRTRWSIASPGHLGRRPGVAPRRGRRPGPLAGRRRAVPPMGHRGRVRQRPAALGGRRRAVHRSRPRLGALQAAVAQRRPLEHGLPRRAGRRHVRRRGHGAPRGAPLPPPPPQRRGGPVARPDPGPPAGDYVASVLERFANTGVRDQIARLCIDGSAKFPTFLLPTVAFQLDTTDRSPAAPWRWPAGPGTWPAFRRTGRRSTPPATWRGSTPGGPRTSRPASSTSRRCSRDGARQRPVPGRLRRRVAARRRRRPTRRDGGGHYARSLSQDGAAPMTTTDSTEGTRAPGGAKLQHHRQREIYVLALRSGSVDVSDLPGASTSRPRRSAAICPTCRSASCSGACTAAPCRSSASTTSRWSTPATC